jgi:hypothetical protein
MFVCLMMSQQYFSHIVAVSFIGGVPGENHRPLDALKFE